MRGRDTTSGHSFIDPQLAFLRDSPPLLAMHAAFDRGAEPATSQQSKLAPRGLKFIEIPQALRATFRETYSGVAFQRRKLCTCEILCKCSGVRGAPALLALFGFLLSPRSGHEKGLWLSCTYRHYQVGQERAQVSKLRRKLRCIFFVRTGRS